MKKIIKERDNIVRIANKEMVENYVNSILFRMNSSTYNKFGCIKIQVTDKYKEFAEYIIKRWKSAGLIEVDRKKKEIKVVTRTGESYILKDAWEITLKKIPGLMMIDDGI